MLKDSLPERYQKSGEICGILLTMQGQADALKEAAEELLQNLNISTAERLLPIWEKLYGIKSSALQTAAERRETVMARMRGTSVSTVNELETAAGAFFLGKVTVEEQPGEYRFKVIFSEKRGVPPQLEKIKEIIEELKPAHLAVEYEFAYITYGDLRQYTYGEMGNKTWKQLREEAMDNEQ